MCARLVAVEVLGLRVISSNSSCLAVMIYAHRFFCGGALRLEQNAAGTKRYRDVYICTAVPLKKSAIQDDNLFLIPWELGWVIVLC